jgi:hypothetical protein
MKRLMLGLVLMAASLMAADVTGKWTGTLVEKGEQGERSFPALLVLKQAGTALTGTAGPNEGERYDISKAVVDGDQITFEVEREVSVMKFDLKLEGDRLSGTVTRERDGRKESARLEVKRSQ